MDQSRRSTDYQGQQIISVQVALFAKTGLPVTRLLELLRGVRIHLNSDESQSLQLGKIVVYPQLQGSSRSWEPSSQDARIDAEAVAWLWTFYTATSGYWWKSTNHDWTTAIVDAAGIDAEIPWASVPSGTIRSLHDLASLRRFGVTLPWELVTLGLEEVSLQFRTATSAIDFDFSQHGLDGLAWLQHEQQRAVPQTSYFPLGLSLSGQRALEELRGAFIRRELQESSATPYRGIMGLSGPGGRSVRFFPNMPKQFMDSDASREYSFRVTVPARGSGPSPVHDASGA